MKSLPISFESTQEIKTFVEIVNKFDCDIDLKYGRYLIDAKSLLGVLTLAHAKEIMMLVHSEQCDSVFNSVSAFAQ